MTRSKWPGGAAAPSPEPWSTRIEERNTPRGSSGTDSATTRQAVVAFVIIKESYLAAHDPAGLATQLRSWVGEQIGAIARPRDIYIVGELPTTRSGKIMRRLLSDVAEGREVGDTPTLADTAVMSIISAQVK